ncbi:hypothetical protein [Melittangium boletus]|uniref:Lipoprotein n=1 Tax=Melittangium boletus DSM 14713 TaxID=1294270 RepID=A0A250IRN2_9BACT|nr:hypothetical protein [Melittangium boletus]ATB34394.1 hypothetical protein MEBOL_007896 [Melittangium boletus DSM 14713]
MKGIKAMVLGASAAALIFSVGCQSDQPRDTQRQEELESPQDTQGTGGSGMGLDDSSVPSEDTLRGIPGQDSDVHSPTPGSAQMGSGATEELVPLQQRDLNTGSTAEPGIGGAGGTEPQTQDTDTRQMKKGPNANGVRALGNETGSRTNATGSNISTDTNPTEPRQNAKSQVPGPRDNPNR